MSPSIRAAESYKVALRRAVCVAGHIPLAGRTAQKINATTKVYLELLNLIEITSAV